MSEYIHFSWHASTPLWAGDRRLERGHPHVKRQAFSISESRESLLVLCFARRKKTKSTDDKPSAEKACILCRGAKEEDRRSTDVWINTNRTNNGETST